MADYFTIITARESIDCSQEDYDRLYDVFEPTGEDENGYEVEQSQLTLDYYQDRKVLYIYGEDGGANEEHITEEGLKILGEIIQKAGKEYLEFGAGSYCTRARPGSSGGYYFRVYADGTLRYSKQVWDEKCDKCGDTYTEVANKHFPDLCSACAEDAQLDASEELKTLARG